MRRLLIGLCIGAQVLVLGGMVFGRESVVQNGQRIYLRTAPIDPRDLFRGDYVRLRYPMNDINNLSVKWSPSDFLPVRGEKVYAVLSSPTRDIYDVAYLTNKKPESGLFIRGRIDSRLLNNRFSNNRFTLNSLKFGIEQLFVEQGAGVEIENKQGLRGGLQVPMEVEVALGRNGVAVVTGYRWSSLGIELSFPENENENENEPGNREEQDERQPQLEREPNTTLTIRVENVSDSPLVLNNPGNDCGFMIEPRLIHSSKYKQALNDCNGQLEPNYLSLESGEAYSLNVNPGDPRWYIQNEAGVPFDMRTLSDSEFFRIVYQSPENTETLENEAIWIGELSSPAFNSRGRID